MTISVAVLESLFIGELDDDALVDLLNSVTSLNFIQNSQGTAVFDMTVHDPGLRMHNANYFMVGRRILFNGQAFEVTSVDVNHAQNTTVKIMASTQSILEMRRDKVVRQWKGANPSEAAKLVAEEYGLDAFIEPSPADAPQVKQETKEDEVESVYDMLARLAKDKKLEFEFFEADNVLFFASAEYIMQYQSAGGNLIRIRLSDGTGTPANQEVSQVPSTPAPPDTIDKIAFYGRAEHLPWPGKPVPLLPRDFVPPVVVELPAKTGQVEPPPDTNWVLSSANVKRTSTGAVGASFDAAFLKTLASISIFPGTVVEFLGINGIDQTQFMIEQVQYDATRTGVVSISGSTTEDPEELLCTLQTFRPGDQGECVARIQKAVKAKETKIWDAVTTRQVARFQEANKLPVDGVWNKDDWDMLKTDYDKPGTATSGGGGGGGGGVPGNFEGFIDILDPQGRSPANLAAEIRESTRRRLAATSGAAALRQAENNYKRSLRPLSNVFY